MIAEYLSGLALFGAVPTLVVSLVEGAAVLLVVAFVVLGSWWLAYRYPERRRERR